MDYSEYLDLAVQIVETNERPGEPFPAAALGSALRKAAPEVDFKSFGKRSLGEVLTDLQARGRITITETTKGALAVERVQQGHNPPSQGGAFNPLHRAIWEAFTFVAPHGRRFLNRLTGLIRVGLASTPSPADEWVEFTPITGDLQRSWAEEFAKEEGLPFEDDLRPLLKQEKWSAHAFVTALREQNPQAARMWNAFRSKRVSAHVQQWLADNALPPGWAFQQRPRPIHGVTTPLTQGLTDDEAETRSIVMTALGQMPLSQLLSIPIPVGLVLNALSTRKR